MNYLLTICCLLTFASPALAQQATTIKGAIVDKKGEAVIGANIFLDGSYDGTSTDIDGSYAFTTEATGQQLVLIQYLGYEDQQHTVNLKGEAAVELNITLAESSIQLSAANVTASRFGKTSDQHRTEVLSTLDILTTGGANADVVSALRTMPGTQQVGEQEGLFVRGGTGDETAIFVDGMAVPNFFYSGADNVAQRGRFNPSLFQGTFFSSGGFSAAYGQALSGSLNLESVDMPLKSQFSASVNTVGGQGELVKLFNKDRSAVAASVNYTNLQPYYGLVPQDREFNKMPEFLDGSLNLRHKVSETGSLKYFGQVGRSELAFERNSIDYPERTDGFGIQNNNAYSNLIYSDMIGERWKISSAIAYSRNEDDVEQGRAMANEERVDQEFGRLTNFYQARSTATWIGDNGQKVQTGAEYQHHDQLERAGDLSREQTEDYGAAFIEGTFPLFERFSARLGLRTEYSASIDRYNLAPRAALSYEVAPKQQINFAWGEYYQAPHLRFVAQNPSLHFQESTHYILGYQKNDPRRTFRAEIFHKDYRRLIKTAPAVSNDGAGYARGLELFWRDKKLVKNLDYWISYSYLDTERDFLDFPRAAQPTFAADHTASIAVKQFIPGIATNISATYAYATGRPYFNPNQSEAEFLSSRTRDFQNLSFTVAHLTKIGSAFATFVFSVSNVLGTEQIFGYEYGTVNPAARRAITPTAPRFIYLGAFFNWGIDQRKQTAEGFM
jgi:hypothetical protein